MTMTLPTISEIARMDRSTAEAEMARLQADPVFLQALKSGKEPALKIFDALEERSFQPETRREQDQHAYPHRPKFSPSTESQTNNQ